MTIHHFTIALDCDREWVLRASSASLQGHGDLRRLDALDAGMETTVRGARALEAH
jgi:hypothetical protein